MRAVGMRKAGHMARRGVILQASDINQRIAIVQLHGDGTDEFLTELGIHRMRCGGVVMMRVDEADDPQHTWTKLTA